MKITKHGPLSDSTIANLRGKACRYEVKDSRAPGLQLRITPSGVKTFRMSVREGTRQRWITLGRWSPSRARGCLTIAQARDWIERLQEAHRVKNLAEVELALYKEMRPEAPAPVVGGLTVAEVAKDFLANLDRKRPEQAARPLEKDILPDIGTRSLASVKPDDCRRIVRGVVARGSLRQAGVVLAILNQFLDYAVDNSLIDVNPAARLKAKALGVKSSECSRFLSAGEIDQFWRALDAYRGLTPAVRGGLKILLLTGVRSGELLKARVVDLDFAARTWRIPVENQKMTRAMEEKAKGRADRGDFIVPLAPMALKLFEELAALAKGLASPHVMASFHAATPGDALTDKSLNHAMRRLFEGDAALLKFDGERPTPHCLRRTCRTNLTDLGVSFEVAEKCLNHSLGKIARTYDLASRLEARRDALERWDAHVRGLISAS